MNCRGSVKEKRGRGDRGEGGKGSVQGGRTVKGGCCPDAWEEKLRRLDGEKRCQVKSTRKREVQKKPKKKKDQEIAQFLI